MNKLKLPDQYKFTLKLSVSLSDLMSRLSVGPSLFGGPEKVFSPGSEPTLRGPDGSKPFPKLNLLVARRTLGFDNIDRHTSGIHLTG